MGRGCGRGREIGRSELELERDVVEPNQKLADSELQIGG